MKSKLPVILFIALFVWMCNQNTSYTYSSGNITSRTNAPGESSCAASGCHGSSSTNGTGSTTISIAGGATAYELGETYSMTVTTDDQFASLYGMQMTALAGENITETSISAGSFVAPSGMQIRNSDTREYIVHQFTANGTGTWEFEWIAPNEDVGPVTFYLASLAANGNGNKNGDKVYFNTFTINAPVAAVECPQNLTISPSTLDICNGDSFSVSPNAEGSGTFLYNWTLDGDFIEPNTIISPINSGCAPLTQTIVCEAICQEDPNITETATMEFTVYPNDVNAFVTVLSFEGNCETAVGIDPNCGDYLEVNEQNQIGEAGESGTHTYSFTYDDNGSGCIAPFQIEIPFSCTEEFVCTAEAGTITDLEENYCQNQNVSFNGVGFNETDDYMQQYILAGQTDNLIKAFVSNPEFGLLPNGEYCVYPFNFHKDSISIIPTIGSNVTALPNIPDSCFDFDLETCYAFTVDEECVGLDDLDFVNAIALDLISFTGNQAQIALKTQSAQKLKCRIMNIAGQVILEKDLWANPGDNQFAIETRDLPQGLFLLNISTENQQLTRKFIK